MTGNAGKIVGIVNPFRTEVRRKGPAVLSGGLDQVRLGSGKSSTHHQGQMQIKAKH